MKLFLIEINFKHCSSCSKTINKFCISQRTTKNIDLEKEAKKNKAFRIITTPKKCKYK